VSAALPWVVGIVAIYATGVALAAVVGLALKAPRPAWLDQFGWMLTALSVVLALCGLMSLGEGSAPDSRATFLGYLGALAVVMPLAMMSVREDRGTWSNGVIAAAAAATAVLAVRVALTR
jgi:hypothetical protein